MNTLLSAPALDGYLADIKRTFINYDFGRLKKMIFLNADSFFHFIDCDREPGETGLRFKEIIEVIEPFIPLVISEECLDTYLITAITQSEEELLHLQYQFIQNAKVKFVKNIFNARTDEEIEEIFSVCRTIRDYKEQKGF